MTVQVWKNPDPDNDTLLIQFDEDAMYVIHHGSEVMEPFLDGQVDFDWIELAPARLAPTMPAVFAPQEKGPAVAAQTNPHLDVDISIKRNGSVEVFVSDGSGAAVRSMTATRHYGNEAEAYVGGKGLQTLYFNTKDDADAYVAKGKPGSVHAYIDNLYPVAWELPNGAFVQDLADVIDYARGIDRDPLFDYYRP